MKFTLDILKEDLLGKTITIYPRDNFQDGGYGEVTSIDEYGRLHGTWGERTVTPGETVFEVIGAPTMIRDRYIKIDYNR